MIKLLELFGGIGSPRKALERVAGVENVKKIDYVEFWDWPVNAYNRLFDNNERPQDVRFWNMNVDILVHGSPCQDFSVAGKNDLSTGRSILYRRTLEIIKKELNPRPKFVIWENVKGLLSKKNFPHFQHYLESMEEMGYKNYYQILNSKDFGIPQSRNRVFCISVRNDLDFVFDFDELKKKPFKPLKDFLDHKVDKSYYITQKSMAKAIETGKIKIIDNIAETVTTKQLRWNNAGVVKIPLRNFEQYKYVLDANNELSTTPTLTTNHGEMAFKIAEEIKYATVPLHNKKFNSTDRIHSVDDKMSTIGSNSANNRIAIPIMEIETKDFSEFITIPRQTDGELVNGSYNRVWKENYVGTIPASNQLKIRELVEHIDPELRDVPIFIIDGKPYHLRVLTERECWRLMGWHDHDIDKVIDMPKTKLYHMAGNAIVIQVLEAILKPIVEYLNVSRET